MVIDIAIYTSQNPKHSGKSKDALATLSKLLPSHSLGESIRDLILAPKSISHFLEADFRGVSGSTSTRRAFLVNSTQLPDGPILGHFVCTLPGKNQRPGAGTADYSQRNATMGSTMDALRAGR
jgi:hypothetical protein